MKVSEEWRPVVGYEGKYEVSDLGRVRSLDRVTVDSLGRSRPFKGRVLSPHLGVYPCIVLHGVGRSVTARNHVLVLAAFVGPRPAGMKHIRHLNGNHMDCRLENLAYGTPSENAFDKTRHGTNRNATKTHCPRGHEYTPENTYLRSNRNGRDCKTCTIARASRWVSAA